ncbi:MAG: nodulation protein NfeD [Fidelibacterota bacterium]
MNKVRPYLSIPILLWIIAVIAYSQSSQGEDPRTDIIKRLTKEAQRIGESFQTPAETDTITQRISPVIHVITVNGVIGPISSDFILKSIQEAEKKQVECLIIQLDTPGGLMEAMRDIVKAELGADVPVIMYVAPGGARAASAGVFITLAAHVAAMAPGTNIGAAHPVMMGGTPGGGADTNQTMMDKITNDAVAYIQSIAEKRGRNAEWAKDAVLNSVSITAREALELGVIDTVTASLTILVAYLDGKEVEILSGKQILATRNALVKEIDMGFRYRVLDKITNPNIAYLLLLLGVYGILFELSNPGAIFPGVLGAISLILAFLAFQMLPINYAGLALMALGVTLFILEINITSYGLLAIGGIVSLLLGSLMLFERTEPLMRVSWKVIIPALGFTILFFLFAVGFGVKAQRRTPVTGSSGLLGMTGLTQTDIDPQGQVAVHGEIWKAVSDKKIPAGSSVRVVEVEGMVLKVEKI